jgi:hypothetical protein
MATAPDLRDGERRSAARARWAMALLGGGAALDAFALAAGLSRRGLLGGAAASTAGDEAALRIVLAQLAVFALASLAWFAWLHAAYSNLRAMGTETTRYKPGMAVAYWFAPVVDIIAPHQIVKELWLRSATGNMVEKLSPSRAPWLVTAWWILVLAGGYLGAQQMQAADPIAPTALSIAFDALSATAAVLAIAIVRRITDLQRRAAGRGDGVPSAAVLST